MRANELMECDCPNPEDACSAVYSCTLKDRGCFVDADCPDGYRCFQNLCANKQDDKLTARCIVDEDCPFYFDCVQNGCSIVGTPCIANRQCPIDEICGEIPNWAQNACRTPGPKGGGEPCQTGYECAAGYCFEGDCLTACNRNADCPDDYVCELAQYCSFGPRPVLRALCGDEVIAIGNADGCAEKRCRVNAECPSKNCLDFSCADLANTTICKESEFQRFQHPGKCSTTVGCRSDVQCDAPYVCVEKMCTRTGQQ